MPPALLATSKCCQCGVAGGNQAPATTHWLCPMFCSQQDAQEFLRFLLDGLHSEVNRVLVRPRASTDTLDHLP